MADLAGNASASPPGPGKTIGGWQLHQELGRGAWTIVYQASPIGAGEAGGDYALKLLQPEFERDALAMGLLQREAFVARQVSHPHVMTVLAARVDESPRFLVSPRLTGSTVAKMLAASPRLATPLALWIVRQAAEALDALHASGWLHLDVQPGNVIVSPTGHATLIDLGLARKIDVKGSPGKQPLVGTPAYLAPELIKGTASLSGAADVYSLGVLAYQLLVGTLPFEDDDPLALLSSHIETPPPELRDKLPHLPTRAARLVRKMLAKEPLRRPTLPELIATLTALEIETFAQRRVAVVRTARLRGDS